MISILTSKDDITGRQWPVCYSQLLCSEQSTLIISSFFFAFTDSCPLFLAEVDAVC